MPVRQLSSQGLIHEALLKHHLEDLYEGLEQGSLEIAQFSLKDIYELMKEMKPADREKILMRFYPAIRFSENSILMAEQGIRWGW